VTARKNPQISPRKRPKQARATELVGAILEAAIQVLQKEGAERFTMARVAAKAGVSVGSLYQYFPNKAAILFRLQSDEWRQTTDAMRAILDDQSTAPLERLRALVIAFVHSECEEARMRLALDAAAPRYGEAPEAEALHASWQGMLEGFMKEALPGASGATRAHAQDVLRTTLGAMGKHISESARSPAQVEAFAASLADMFCAYVARLAADPQG
jgi:AcrR family transcriptional regulator